MNVPLTEYYPRHANRVDLVGLQVQDIENNTEAIIQDVDFGIYNTWALLKIINSKEPPYYQDVRLLSIDRED